MKIFNGLVNMISNSKFYIQYVSQWPAPFNIVSFDAVLAIILLIVILKAIWDLVNNYHYSIRYKAKQQRLQEERLDREMREREREKQRQEDDELVRQYLKFLSAAAAHDMLGTASVSLEDFKAAVSTEGDTIEAIETEAFGEPDLDSFDEDTLAEEESEENLTETESLNEDISDNTDIEDISGLYEEDEAVDENVENTVEEIAAQNGIDKAIVQETLEDGDSLEESEFQKLMGSLVSTQKAKEEEESKERHRKEKAKHALEKLNNSLKEERFPEEEKPIKRKTLISSKKLKDKKRGA